MDVEALETIDAEIVLAHAGVRARYFAHNAEQQAHCHFSHRIWAVSRHSTNRYASFFGGEEVHVVKACAAQQQGFDSKTGQYLNALSVRLVIYKNAHRLASAASVCACMCVQVSAVCVNVCAKSEHQPE